MLVTKKLATERRNEWKDTTNQNSRQAFLEGLSTELKPPRARGPRFAMFHAGNGNGLLKLTILCKKNTADAHDEMDGVTLAIDLSADDGEIGVRISVRCTEEGKSTPGRDSSLTFPAIGSLVYCESSALDHAATEPGSKGRKQLMKTPLSACGWNSIPGHPGAYNALLYSIHAVLLFNWDEATQGQSVARGSLVNKNTQQDGSTSKEMCKRGLTSCQNKL
uniref:Uncharacterized protein n=1 Tax=Timema genevievae TaxID=629358 RepID=A0A7R9PN29_TIMGE|nr:unnamed protein product [Timema genevievae]